MVQGLPVRICESTRSRSRPRIAGTEKPDISYQPQSLAPTFVRSRGTRNQLNSPLNASNARHFMLLAFFVQHRASTVGQRGNSRNLHSPRLNGERASLGDGEKKRTVNELFDRRIRISGLDNCTAEISLFVSRSAELSWRSFAASNVAQGYYCSAGTRSQASLGGANLIPGDTRLSLWILPRNNMSQTRRTVRGYDILIAAAAYASQALAHSSRVSVCLWQIDDLKDILQADSRMRTVKLAIVAWHYIRWELILVHWHSKDWSTLRCFNERSFFV